MIIARKTEKPEKKVSDPFIFPFIFPRCKPHHGRVVLAGTEVVLVDLDIVPLAGKFPWVVHILVGLIEIPERGIDITVDGINLIIRIVILNNHLHRTQPVMDQTISNVKEQKFNRPFLGSYPYFY